MKLGVATRFGWLLVGCATACAAPSRYGPPPKSEGPVLAVDPDARPVQFDPAEEGGEWWLARDSGGYECKLPCTRSLPPVTERVLVRPARGDDGERAIPVGVLPRTDPGETLVVRPVPERGQLWIGATGVGSGELLFLSGAALFFTEHQKGGCESSWSRSGTGCSLAKVGLIAGASLGLVGGAYWLFYYRGDSTEVSVVRPF